MANAFIFLENTSREIYNQTVVATVNSAVATYDVISEEGLGGYAKSVGNELADVGSGLVEGVKELVTNPGTAVQAMATPEFWEQTVATGVLMGVGNAALSKNSTHVNNVSNQTIKTTEIGTKVLSKSELKSISSLESRIAEHQQKLSNYISDPMKYDNKGFLKNAPNEQIKQRIIDTRITHLKKEINTFEEQIKKIKNQ